VTVLADGARVLVTRPQQQADNLCQLIGNQGGEPVVFPVLEISAVEPVIGYKSVIDRVNNSDWVIFVSANAVRFACAGQTDRSLQVDDKVRVAVLGKATATALKAIGWPVHLLPESGFNSEALLAMEALQQVKGRRFLIVRGQGGREHLAKILVQKGAVVDYLEVYRRIKPKVDEQRCRQVLVADGLDAIILTSGEALQNLLDIAGENVAILLKSVPLVVISDRMQKIAKEMGFSRIRVTDEPGDAAIVKTIKALLNGE
jgi:uroporphyrinogen-III synthase